MRWTGHVTRMVEIRSAYSILIGKPEGKRPLWRPRSRWKDNIGMDEIVWVVVDWINVVRMGTSGGFLWTR